MSLNRRQQRQLSRIESRLLGSDPHLAAMLAAFGQLADDQRLPSREQIATRLDRIRQAQALIAGAIATLVTALGLLAGAILALFTALVTGRPARHHATAASVSRRTSPPGVSS
jgi:ABC-type nitrate/sulfonate/bicarbonate transport system permease component